MRANRKNSNRRALLRAQQATRWRLVIAGSLVGLLSPTAVLAAGDAVAGKRLYEVRCLGCHGDSQTGGQLGPSLVGIIGRKAGTGESGVHSRALIESAVTWDEASLRKFLAAPTKQVAGTNMPVGVPNSQQIDDLVAYFRTLH